MTQNPLDILGQLQYRFDDLLNAAKTAARTDDDITRARRCLDILEAARRYNSLAPIAKVLLGADAPVMDPISAALDLASVVESLPELEPLRKAQRVEPQRPKPEAPVPQPSAVVEAPEEPAPPPPPSTEEKAPSRGVVVPLHNPPEGSLYARSLFNATTSLLIVGGAPRSNPERRVEIATALNLDENRVSFRSGPKDLAGLASGDMVAVVLGLMSHKDVDAVRTTCRSRGARMVHIPKPTTKAVLNALEEFARRRQRYEGDEVRQAR